MSDLEDVGAVDFIVVEFPRREMTGELIPGLLDLVDRRLIRVMDVVIVLTSDDGSFETLTPDDLDPAEVGELGSLAGAASGLLNHEDAAEIAALMQPSSGALVLVWENLWSLPFGVAIRKAGGRLLSQGHIPTQALVAALEADPT